jgi:hypothetical protein
MRRVIVECHLGFQRARQNLDITIPDSEFQLCSTFGGSVDSNVHSLATLARLLEHDVAFAILRRLRSGANVTNAVLDALAIRCPREP